MVGSMRFTSLKRVRSSGRENGCSLLEAVLATRLMAGALTSLGQMFAISVANSRSARAGSYATVLAQQKLEQLRGLTWSFDSLGRPNHRHQHQHRRGHRNIDRRHWTEPFARRHAHIEHDWLGRLR